MRLLLTTLTTVLALALTGCGGDPDATTLPETPAAPADAATEAPADTPTEADAADGSGEEPVDQEPAGDQPAGEPPADDEQPTDEVAVDGDCSAAGLELAVADADAELPDATRDTAGLLLDAAVRCDEQLLHTAATESDASFLFGAATVDELFALPEDPARDPAPWEALARLLGGTSPTMAEDSTIWAWPAAFGEDATDADWQELVDAGLYDQGQVDQMRSDGYLGWRVGIDVDGTWRYMTAGD